MAGTAPIYAKGLFDKYSVSAPIVQPDGGSGFQLPTPGDVQGNITSDVNDSKLANISEAVAARVLYTAAPGDWLGLGSNPLLNKSGNFPWRSNPSSYIDIIPAGATRNNAQGYAQLLYLDIYPAYSTFSLTDSSGASDAMGNRNAQAPIVFYWHGGGFDVGYANNRDGIIDIVRHFCNYGYHVVVPEYRRGWTPIAKRAYDTAQPISGSNPAIFDKIGVSDWFKGDLNQISGILNSQANGYNNRGGIPSYASTLFQTLASGVNGMAIQDSIDAVVWTKQNILTVLPNAYHQYYHIGNSAGGSIAAQLSLAPGTATDISAQQDGYYPKWRGVQSNVFAATPNFGSCNSDSKFVHELSDVSNRPVVIFNIQGNDYLSPLRTNHSFYQSNMPVMLGMFDLWHKLATAEDGEGNREYSAIGWIDMLGAHGYGQFMLRKGPNNRVVEHLEYLPQMTRLKKSGSPVPSHVVFKTVNETNDFYETLNTEYGYPSGSYYIGITEGEGAGSLYNLSTTKGTQPDTLTFATMGSDDGIPANGRSPFLGYYNRGGNTSGIVTGWGPYWLGEFLPPSIRPQDYFNKDGSDVGLKSVEGQMIQSSGLTQEQAQLFINTSYYSNFDTRPSGGYP
jgi:acetyl esterase/lipase